MENKLVMRTMMLARLMVLPTLMVITGLSLAKQMFSSVQPTERSVLSNLQQDGGLYMAQKAQPEDTCHPPGGICDRKILKN
ncbi:hypothetical protein [Microcoleus sp. herbarium12]|uniref:hypothetical protein n=1 Tax=Microcoleus sp. herbarium12 TaxID=3055437 RepID=UPI002FD2C570